MTIDDEMNELSAGMGRLDGPRAGRDEMDELLGMEAKWNEEGRAAGIADGTKQGIHDGRELGISKGHELGQELGYYSGCALAWLNQPESSKQVAVSGRARKSLESVISLVEAVPLDDVADAKLSDVIDQVRAKWKAALSQMGLTVRQEGGGGSHSRPQPWGPPPAGGFLVGSASVVSVAYGCLRLLTIAYVVIVYVHRNL
eukprot:CAMPEP_0172003528 /NCGR_PEP_ID=MMETSP1041-20130122/3987_1 /TAXON_ID=464988 /ORGANISM="Hemiselmis andersenii, Strain CCMP439" /LENGTH=199 /DNA_ID=CAMNT_0012657313 /DNA_START=194 /DNA_END=790 /DNA_ORIENTATION=-